MLYLCAGARWSLGASSQSSGSPSGWSAFARGTRASTCRPGCRRQLKDEFLANTSHELRTLHGIIGIIGIISIIEIIEIISIIEIIGVIGVIGIAESRSRARAVAIAN